MRVPGVMELLLILALVLFIFGPAKLPGLIKAAGRSVREFRREAKGPDDEEPDDES